VRGLAAEALGQLDDARAVEPLIAALQDEDAHVRRAAGQVLGGLGDPAIEPLIAALRDEDRYVREKAAHVRRRLESGHGAIVLDENAHPSESRQ